MKLIFKVILINLIAANVNGQNVLPDIIVAKDGTGNFESIQDAFNHATDFSERPVVIFVKRGLYEEKITLAASKTNIVLVGEDKNNTNLSFNDHTGKIVGTDTINTYNSFSTRILGDNFTAYNITFNNTAGYNAGQAVALEINSDKAAFYNCRFIGDQDALFTNSDGRTYFSNCYIEGTTDFIFGKSIAVFDTCTILCKKNSFITAASTPEGNNYGYVFRNCSVLHADSISKVYLGRPWRDFAKVVFLNCYLDDHILPEGWHNWSKPWREKTAFYAEYKNTGPGSNTSGRVNWSCQLTESEAALYNLNEIFATGGRKNPYFQKWLPASKFCYIIK